MPEFICPICLTNFIKSDYAYQYFNNQRDGCYQPVCSHSCAGKLGNNIKCPQGGYVSVICAQCNTSFDKRRCQIKRTTRNFCSRSCAATFNNRNKSHGTRRSKLEIYLEEQIRSNYSNLTILCNDKSIIGSEIDLYLPDLRLAFELNGIFHYEPIYGSDKLTRIQDNDRQKIIRCYEVGIELCIIDTSQCKNLTQARRDEFWSIVRKIISSNIYRIESHTGDINP